MTSGVTSLPPAPPGVATPRRRGRGLVVAAALLLVAPATVWALWNRGEDMTVDARPATAGEIAERYGVEVTMVGESGGGGMIDFRFRVTDPDKAEHVFGHYLPSLVSDDGIHIRMGGMHHDPQILEGHQYFMLFGNSEGTVRSGETVSVVIGDLRLDDFPVQ